MDKEVRDKIRQHTNAYFHTTEDRTIDVTVSSIRGVLKSDGYIDELIDVVTDSIQHMNEMLDTIDLQEDRIREQAEQLSKMHGEAAWQDAMNKIEELRREIRTH